MFVLSINWYAFGGLKPIDREELDTIRYEEFQCRGRTPIIDDYSFITFNYIDFAVYFMVPSLILFLCNIGFIIKLRRLGKVIITARRVNLQTTQVSTKLVSDNRARKSNANQPSRSDNIQQTTDIPEQTGASRIQGFTANPGTSGTSALPSAATGATSLVSHSVSVPPGLTPIETAAPKPQIFTVMPIPHRPQSAARGDQLQSASRAASHAVPAPSQSRAVKRGRPKHVMTRICIVLSISFLIFTSPLMVLNIAIVVELADPENETTSSLARYLWFLSMCNHAMNFWVYCVYWKEFRQKAIDLCKTLCCCRDT